MEIAWLAGDVFCVQNDILVEFLDAAYARVTYESDVRVLRPDKF